MCSFLSPCMMQWWVMISFFVRFLIHPPPDDLRQASSWKTGGKRYFYILFVFGFLKERKSPRFGSVLQLIQYARFARMLAICLLHEASFGAVVHKLVFSMNPAEVSSLINLQATGSLFSLRHGGTIIREIAARCVPCHPASSMHASACISSSEVLTPLT